MSNLAISTIEELAAWLEGAAEDRAVLADLPPELRRRLIVAAGRLSRPDRDEVRALRRALGRKERKRAKELDHSLLHRTGTRVLRAAAVFPTPAQLPNPNADPTEAAEPVPRELGEARKCYVCKVPYRALHHFYDQLCPPCAALNWDKRHQSADLRGRVALVTGGRVKIGYQASIMLLRAGAHVIVTTRFPHDAAQRYAREADFEVWRARVEIHGLDLRHTPSVEAFASGLEREHARLDFILNNACQTVRRPPGYYAHLLEQERAPMSLPREASALVRARDAKGAVASSVELSQVPLLPGEEARDLRLFPDGALDQDLQQVDLRPANSWRMTLAEVPTVELLEVQLVNAIAPFVLNARLRPLMERAPGRDKHIVNVSAMEGQFYRNHKTDKHPHTNMAKAALNMMTRTSAVDYVKVGIHMNSVDTGWVTDEDPIELAAKKVEEHGFSPPLDIVDGAARICDPIFSGLRTGRHVWGQFLKDYAPVPW